jgi:hypothetical protein
MGSAKIRRYIIENKECNNEANVGLKNIIINEILDK